MEGARSVIVRRWWLSLLFATWAASLLAVQAGASLVPADRALHVARGWLRQSPIANAALSPTASPFRDAHGNLLAWVVSLHPSGFVIISADDTLEPVLCFSQSGAFRVAPNRVSVLAALLAQDLPARLRAYSSVSTASAGHHAALAAEWARLEAAAPVAPLALEPADAPPVVRVAPLVSANWDQFYPYNLECPPESPTGCCATAMAMILRCFHFPATAQGSNRIYVRDVPQTVPIDSTFTFDYSMMPDTGYQAPAPQASQIAHLMSACGIALGMHYDLGSSCVPISVMSTAIPAAYVTYFRYTRALWMPGTASSWLPTLQQELLAGRPVQMQVSDPAQAITHSIVCDGWQQQSSPAADWFHLNPGWGGCENDWYRLPAFSTYRYSWDLLLGYVYGFAHPDCSPDGHEPDSTSAAAVSVAAGPEYRTVSPAGDVDWMSFHATPGVAYTITTSQHPGEAAFATNVTLCDAGGGNSLAQSRGAPFSAISWTCPAAGTYLLSVTSAASGATGHYDLTLSARYTIAGRATDDAGDPLPGVTVSAAGVTAVTCADGCYVLASVPPGTHTVAATKGGCTFDPASRETTVGEATGNATGVDFAATSIAADARCDFDADGRVGLADLAVFRGLWRKAVAGASAPEWAGADLNHDGVVDYRDAQIMVEALTARF